MQILGFRTPDFLTVSGIRKDLSGEGGGKEILRKNSSMSIGCPRGNCVDLIWFRADVTKGEG